MKRKLHFNQYIAIPGTCNYKNKLKKKKLSTQQTHFENAAEKRSYRNCQGYEVVVD